jgi:eukaryotic-like serine/threonine-protein kinase
LAYAAERGVLHRDIKPANILLSQYGRPLLADFNLAFRLIERDDATAISFGGTLAYMSPESLDAFNPEHPAGPEVTDARSDIYALGVVLFQLRHGHLPFDTVPGRGRPTPVALSEMAAERRNQPSRICSHEEHHALDAVIQRCLAPNPDGRYASGNELADALEGCRQLRQAERQLPAPNILLRPAFQWTFVWLIALGLIPHLIGSGIQIGYNTVRIVGQLTPLQHDAFMKLVIGYNLIMYPICSAWLLGKVVPVFRAWRSVMRGDDLMGDRMGDRLDSARHQAVELPWKAVLVGCVGWFPGAIIFPLGLYWLSGPLPMIVAGHFVISFALAGLIALTYSYLGTQLVILRVMYVRMWHNPQGFRQTAERELRPIESRVRLFQLMAGTIPLAGAVLIVVVSPQANHAAEYDAFRLLVSVLILLGMGGVQFANLAHRQISQILAIYTNR